MSEPALGRFERDDLDDVRGLREGFAESVATGQGQSAFIPLHYADEEGEIKDKTVQKELSDGRGVTDLVLTIFMNEFMAPILVTICARPV